MPEHQFLDISKLLHCGVYALLRKGEVVYVGKSKKPLVRLYAHYNAQGKRVPRQVGNNNVKQGIVFDGIWFIPCMLGQLDILEVHFIRKYQPKHNVKDKPKVPIAIPEEIKELLKQLVVITNLPPVQEILVAPRGPYIVRRL